MLRVEAGAAVGYGHYFRCKRIVNRILKLSPNTIIMWLTSSEFISDREKKVIFLAEKEAMLRGNKHDSDRVYWRKVLSFRPDLVIVDSYKVDRDWEQRIRLSVKDVKVLVVDDAATRPHYADYVIDSNFYSDYKSVESHYQALNDFVGSLTALGPYVIPSSTRARKRERLSSILIYFGSQDLSGVITDNALQCVCELVNRLDISVTAVQLGMDETRETLRKKYPQIKITGLLETLDDVIEEADLYIGACGSTIWDIIHSELPSIVMATVDNQRLCTSRLSEQGLIVEIATIGQLSNSIYGLVDEGSMSFTETTKEMIVNMNRLNETLNRDRLNALLQGEIL